MYFAPHHTFSVVVFCICLGSLLDLHSFPTRRSSDLMTSSCAAGRWRRRDGRCSTPPRSSAWPGGSPPPDRKSTRLNSSHRCISYAVFCLKKKKKSAPADGADEIPPPNGAANEEGPDH